VGAQGETESSTFENIKFSVGGAPAVEFNVFPYSAYTFGSIFSSVVNPRFGQ